MALLAVKHLDPVVGVDVHSVLVTPGTPPVFLPHPHVGFMLDKREYIQAAKAVVGCIATMIAQEKVNEYLEDHPEDVTKLEHLADEVNQQVNELMGGGKLPDFKNDPNVAEGMKLANEANQIKNRISDDLGSNVGSGGSSGRPIFVNGMMRATAGTHAYHVPGLHFPLGESFAPPPEDPEPSNDGESFMGSKTVLANNDPMSYMALEALSCWSIGMEPPPHNSAHTDRTYPSMPSSVMLPIPAGRPVFVGGPPIVNMAAAAKGLFKAFQGSKWAKALADKLNLKSGFLRCNVLKAEPVDVTTGEVVVQQNDFTVSGRLPLVWDRHYASHDRYAGTIGIGWQTPADIRLELIRNEGRIGAVAHFPDHVTAFNTVPADDGWPARTYDWQHGHALYCDDGRMVLRTREGIEYGFVLPSRWREAASAIDGDSRLMLSIDRMADLHGNAWAFERDVHGALARLVEWKREGRTGRLVKCGTGRGPHAGLLISLTMIDASGNAHPLVSYEHDREHNLAAAIDAMAHPHHFHYADEHRMVSHTSARGVSFYYSYRQGDDGMWRVDHAWGDNGLYDYRFVYDRARMETRVTNSLGHTSIMQMTEREMPIAEIDPLGGVTGYRYDPQGRTSAVIDPAGHMTAWEYDSYGNLIVQILPDGSTIKTEFSPHHHPVCITLIGGRQWRYEWDAFGNLLAEIDPSGAISRYTYDEYGQLVEHIGPRGASTRFDYDRDGNLAEQINALGHRKQYRYDARAYLIDAIDVLGQQRKYEYDRNGNLTRATEPGGREIHCVYDAEGNLTRYRDTAGHVTQMEYSPLGEIRKQIAPDGTEVEYRYDTEGQLIGVVNERGELYALERDAVGRIVVETDYWGQARYYQYGIASELLYSTDPLGQTIEYRYDQLGRIVEKRVPHPEHDNGVQINNFTYDRHGDLVLAQNPYCRVEFLYDDTGRVIEERQGDDFTIASDYDTFGNRVERRTRFITGSTVVEHTVHYTYDALNSVTSIQIDGMAPIVLGRDTLGQICTEQLTANLRREMSYESDGQLASQRTLLTGTGVLFASEYTYGANGELFERRDSRSGIERFQYDPVGRVIAHLDPTGQLCRYLYDPASDLMKTRTRERRTSDAATPAKNGRWVREGEYDNTYYAHDRIGNLIRKQDVKQDLTLHWDAAGQLVETAAVRPALASSRGTLTHIRTSARYGYDPFHRRVRKIVHTHTAEAGGTLQQQPSYVSRFFWDGNTLVAEYAADSERGGIPSPNVTENMQPLSYVSPECSRTDTGMLPDTLVSEWIYYPETFRPLAIVQENLKVDEVFVCASKESRGARGMIRFFQNDPNGAPVRMYDVGGKIVWEARYLPTGGTECIGGKIAQPLRLQGQYYDDESGLTYNRHRYYDSTTGNFISQDSIGLVGGTNLYRFAPNILEWIDPFGREAIRVYHYTSNENYNGIIGTGVIKKHDPGKRGKGAIAGKPAGVYVTTLSPDELNSGNFRGQIGLTNNKSTHFITFEIDEDKVKKIDPQDSVKRLYIPEDVRLRDENNKQRSDVKHGPCPKKKKNR
ncbi:RHS repeat-associated core domain-containing protein [Burkholderia pseudomultivorans]|uniref:RHS repeat-associated core domain-containing protein n=1 Tax=Burkholderia pseudomultivorans TaxID=1207504 RepID=UPI0009BE24A2|nr:RHS repeat-associated core domain-containing protein [Burkholderia pseudomultivorans]